MQKYKIIESTAIEYEGHKLYRIEALRDFGNIKKGERGGYVETENNLSHEGNCWIYNDAKVYGRARVFEDALIWRNSEVFNHAEVYGKAQIWGNAEVHGYSKVYDNAEVTDRAQVFGLAKVFGNATLSNQAEVYAEAQVYGKAQVYGNAMVYGFAKVYGSAEVGNNAEIKGVAKISKTMDYYVGKNIWSSGRFFTYTRSNRMWAVGCFYGTSKELIDKANLDTLVSGREYERIVNYVEAMYNDLEND
nr:MAG TPA: Putative transferase, nesg, ydcK, Structural Genomics.38A [Caudoviricetes sp.]